MARKIDMKPKFHLKLEITGKFDSNERTVIEMDVNQKVALRSLAFVENVTLDMIDETIKWLDKKTDEDKKPF